MHTDEPFSTFFHGVLKESEGLTDELVLPHYRRVPRRLDGASPHRYKSPEDRYCHAYLEALE